MTSTNASFVYYTKSHNRVTLTPPMQAALYQTLLVATGSQECGWPATLSRIIPRVGSYVALIDRGLITPRTATTGHQHKITTAGFAWIVAEVEDAHAFADSLLCQWCKSEFKNTTHPAPGLAHLCEQCIAASRPTPEGMARGARLFAHRDCGHAVLNGAVMDACEIAAHAELDPDATDREINHAQHAVSDAERAPAGDMAIPVAEWNATVAETNARTGYDDLDALNQDDDMARLHRGCAHVNDRANRVACDHAAGARINRWVALVLPLTGQRDERRIAQTGAFVSRARGGIDVYDALNALLDEDHAEALLAMVRPERDHAEYVGACGCKVRYHVNTNAFPINYHAPSVPHTARVHALVTLHVDETGFRAACGHGAIAEYSRLDDARIAMDLVKYGIEHDYRAARRFAAHAAMRQHECGIDSTAPIEAPNRGAVGV
jgi:hypothetical protein